MHLEFPFFQKGLSMYFLFSALLLLVLSSCGHLPCHYNVVGPDEFVKDSYRIRQGKCAILEMMGEAIEPMDASLMQEYEDAISEDDILNIALFHPTRIELRHAFEYINQAVGGFRVSQGAVQLPDLPPIPVAGLTMTEARDRLAQAVRTQYEDAELFISYHGRLDRKVELTGNVAINSMPVNGKIRLYEVLSAARIPRDANLFMSYVLRNGKKLPIDLHRLLHEGDLSHNIVMRGGDKVFIAHPNDAVVMVMGEVNHPSAVSIPYGSISLPEAIVRANGIPFTGDKSNIQIIRGDLECPKIYVLSWEHIINLPNRSLLLIPGDTVYVSAKPITEWNRFISQLMPTLCGVSDAREAYHLFY